MIVIEKKDYLKITHPTGKEYLLFDWYNATIPFNDYKETHHTASAYALKKGIKTLVADCSKMKYSFLSEVTDYYKNTVSQQFHEDGVKRIITVLNDSAMSKLNTSTWQKDGDIELKNVLTMEEAEVLIVK